MIFSLPIIVALAARVIASPVVSRASASDTLYSELQSLFYTYYCPHYCHPVITNDPAGNYVVAANIDTNSGNLVRSLLIAKAHYR